jgi:hypothetical protein
MTGDVALLAVVVVMPAALILGMLAALGMLVATLARVTTGS